ncbi:CidA/LrgA family protein [Rhizobiaceae bacterium BDR2-2]|uniref:CidA/LrgA family protein n=1 Tax=Ectorhizobium quercum TaxID=2965071 RepID=A0AAE3N0V1_9HYPH|nr:CidA/LrgA family protein [Ectorhizobium quercum]MCX8998943.1 CidA/LrgA family protein [Ectorhizobium quercum]
MTSHITPLRRIGLTVRHVLHRSMMGQIALIVLFWMVGELIVSVTRLPVPGGVAGLFIVLALLVSGRLRLVSMQRGARWFIAELLLFFVPAVLAVMDHREFIGLTGLKILAVIVVGTAAVMLVTALAVDFGYRMMLRRGKVTLHAAE